MKHPDNRDVYLAQYRRVPDLISRPYDGVVGEAVLNHLLDRNAMEGEEEVAEELRRADERLAQALSATSQDWWKQLNSWAGQCGFVSALWWVTALYRARREDESPSSLAEVLQPLADAVVRVTGGRPQSADDGVRVKTIVQKFCDALRVGVAHTAGTAATSSQAGRAQVVPVHLLRFAQAVPVMVIPGSTVIGFQLPRERPGEPASGPAERSLAALDVVMAAGEHYSPDRDADALHTVVDDPELRAKLWKDLGAIHRAAGPSSGEVRIMSTVPGHEATVEWPVGRPARKPRRTQRQTEVHGVVRAVDLDRPSLRLQVEGARWSTTVELRDCLFTAEDLLRIGERLGRSVALRGHTKDEQNPPRLMSCDEFLDQ